MQFGSLSFISNISRSRQWECLQRTLQPWHTLLTRGALILRLSTMKLGGLSVWQRASLFLSSHNSLVDLTTWWRIPSAGCLGSYPQSGPSTTRSVGPCCGYGVCPSLCHQPELQASCICLFIPRSHVHCDGCLPVLGSHGALRLHPVSSDQASLFQALAITRDVSHPNCSILAKQGVVPRPTASDCQHSSPSTDAPRPPAVTTLSLLPKLSPCFSTDCMETI